MGAPVAVRLKVTLPPVNTVRLIGCRVMTGAAVFAMVRTAPLLMAVPAELVATSVYVPASEAWTLLSVRLALVAPVTFEVPLRHWYVGAGVPVAAAVNVTLPPMDTVWLCGCVVMVGLPVAAGETMIWAVPLVTGPERLVYCQPSAVKV